MLVFAKSITFLHCILPFCLCFFTSARRFFLRVKMLLYALPTISDISKKVKKQLYKITILLHTELYEEPVVSYSTHYKNMTTSSLKNFQVKWWSNILPNICESVSCSKNFSSVWRKRNCSFPTAKLHSTGRTKATMEYKANNLYESSFNIQVIATHILAVITCEYTLFLISLSG